jgi:hypothetical protein
MQIFRCQQEIFLLLSRQALEPAELSVHLVPRLSSVRIKQPGRGADLSGLEVKNAPHNAFMVSCLIRDMGKFTYYIMSRII